MREESKAMNMSRRLFMKTGLIMSATAATGLIMPKEASAAPARQLFTNINEPRLISFRNLHTGEIFTGPYKMGDAYIPDSLKKISYTLRDHRTGDAIDMDQDLFDYLHALKVSVNKDNDFVVLSGYRSPKTNEMLRRKTEGVARNSYHTKGRAVDIRMPGVDTRKLQLAAEKLRLGGVGHYISSGFIHLDTGPIRTW